MHHSIKGADSPREHASISVIAVTDISQAALYIEMTAVRDRSQGIVVHPWLPSLGGRNPILITSLLLAIG
jgi:hypothetical protein